VGHLGARIMGKRNKNLWGIPFFEMPHKHAFFCIFFSPMIPAGYDGNKKNYHRHFEKQNACH
jgi:hypothetical protein